MDLAKWAEVMAQAQKQWDAGNRPLAELHRSMAMFQESVELVNRYRKLSQLSMANKVLGLYNASHFSAASKAFGINNTNHLTVAGKVLGTFNNSHFANINLAVMSKSFHDNLEKFKFLEYDLVDLAEEKTLPENIIIDEAKRVKSIIYDIYKNNEIIHKIDARNFEEVVAELLMLRKFKVELTKRTRDGGYDILAIQDVGGLPMKFLVECKRYAKNRGIGIEIVRQFMDVINQENANAGLIVTTSYFTTGAVERQQQHPYRLKLEDRLDVLSWVEQYCKRY